AGETADLAFNFEDNQNEKVAEQPNRTNLTLRVPAEAKVFLAGAETRSSGAVREFSTSKLAAGQEWNDYVVRVELDRNGEKLVNEQKLTLVGGQDRELNVDFDLKLARAND